MAWFNDKFFAEVSGPLVTERIYKRNMSDEQGGGPPETDAIRAARHKSAIIWPISAGWRDRAIGSPASG